jgi:hypothetical protein
MRKRSWNMPEKFVPFGSHYIASEETAQETSLPRIPLYFRYVLISCSLATDVFSWSDLPVFSRHATLIPPLRLLVPSSLQAYGYFFFSKVTCL